MIYVACFDAETGNRRWIRYLGTATPELDQFQGGVQHADEFGEPAPGDYRHRLLTLDGSTLYYQTNLGAVIALDAETGATQWVATYPRQEANRFGQGSERDLNPAVVHEGRVIVAPERRRRHLRLRRRERPAALEDRADRRRRQAEPRPGRGQGAAGRHRRPRAALRRPTGKLVGVWPDSANKSLEGYGRGLLAGDLIYWPTQSEIQVLDQRTGLKARAADQAPGDLPRRRAGTSPRATAT